MSNRWIIYLVLGRSSRGAAMKPEYVVLFYGVLAMVTFCVLTGIALSM